MGDNYIVWNQKLSVNVNKIDGQHRELFEQLNRFLAAVLRGEGRETTKSLVEFLLCYVDLHFSTEEYFMSKYQYPAYLAHKKEHERLTEGVRKAASRIRTGQPTRDVVVQLGTQMGLWVAEHIQKMDKRLGAFLKSLGERLDEEVPGNLKTQLATARAGGRLEQQSEHICPYFEGCLEMFNKFQDSECMQFWVERFCRAFGNDQCHRKRILVTGVSSDEVPLSLLPNGDYLLHLR